MKIFIMKKYTYGLENESIIADSKGSSQYTINKEKTSKVITDLFQKHYPQFKNMIKPEFDACQVELINLHPHNRIEDATEEIAEGLYCLENIVKEFWLFISEIVAPKTQWPYIVSDSSHLETHQRYIKINEKLEASWVRASTNIAGLHINIWHKDNRHLLILHKKISEAIYELFKRGRIPVDMDLERYKKYKEVTDSLGWSHLPLIVNCYWEYLDKKGMPITQGHTLVRLKKYGEQLVSEIRTPDAWTSAEDLYKKIQDQANFLQNFL